MTKRIVLALAAATGLFVPAASAQVFGPAAVGRPDVGRPPSMGGPAVSPYLNMTHGGLPGVNYFDLVRPQIDTAESLQNVQQQVGTLGTALRTPPTAQTPLTTGHAAGYFTTSHYFPQRYPLVGANNRR